MGEESWVLPEIPEPYWVNEVRIRCRACAMAFEILVPNGDEVVKLRETGGTGVKWLPTYGYGGYLDLLARVVPGWTPKSDVNQQVAAQFGRALAEIAEKSERGRAFTFDGGQRLCPSCGGVDLVELGERALTNPPLDWLRIARHHRAIGGE